MSTRNFALKLAILKRFERQIDFARHIGESEDHVSRVVNGRSHLPQEQQIEWAKALCCTPQELGFEEGA